MINYINNNSYWTVFIFLFSIISIFIYSKQVKSKNSKNEKSEFQLIIDFLKDRTRKPSSSIAYWLYFLIIVLVIGVCGSLISALPSYDIGVGEMKATSLSLIGYAVVLLCSSSIELIFIDLKESEDKYNNIKKAIVMLGVSLVIISIIIGLITYFVNNELFRLVLSIFGCLLAAYFWWITNAMNSSVLEATFQTSVDSTTGGIPLKDDLQGQIPHGYNE